MSLPAGRLPAPLWAALFLGLLTATAPAADKPAEPAVKHFLIVAPDEVHDALKEYVEYKKKLRPTELVSLEDVLKKTDGADDPERLKRFLYDAWPGLPRLCPPRRGRGRRAGALHGAGPQHAGRIRLRLLPVRPLLRRPRPPGRPSSTTGTPTRTAFTPATSARSAVRHNKKDPINYDEIDYRPEIAVGRWPVDTGGRGQDRGGKTMAYGTGRPDGTKGTAYGGRDLVHPAGWVDARGQMDGLARKMPDGWTAGR